MGEGGLCLADLVSEQSNQRGVQLVCVVCVLMRLTTVIGRGGLCIIGERGQAGQIVMLAGNTMISGFMSPTSLAIK